MSRASYNDYYRTGVQDCQNVSSVDDFWPYLNDGTATQIVERVWKQWERDGIKEGWLEQNEDVIVDDGLDRDRAYDEWAAGWRSCAVDVVQRMIDEGSGPRDLAYFTKVTKLAYSWADPHYPFAITGRAKDLLAPYMAGVPADGDRGFWLGEVLDQIRYHAKDELAPWDLRKYTTLTDELRARRDAKRTNPASFTKKGNDLYHKVLAANRLALEGKRRAAPADAKRTVVRAAQRGVPGLVRKNPAPPYVVTDTSGRIVFTYTLGDDIEQALDLFTFWINENAPRSIRRHDEDPSVVDENGGLTLTFEDPPATYYLHEPRTNPMRYGAHEPAEIFEEDATSALDKYKEFHRYDPKKVEEIRGLAIPRRVRRLGPAAYVLYRSGKVDPATLEKPRKPVDYIHEHDAGVTIYATDGAPDTDVPKSIYETTALVRLGYCLGFKLKDGTEAQGTAPLPDLCCTPDGKCLLVVQSKRKVLAMFWGGALGVFARGIDG